MDYHEVQNFIQTYPTVLTLGEGKLRERIFWLKGVGVGERRYLGLQKGEKEISCFDDIEISTILIPSLRSLTPVIKSFPSLLTNDITSSSYVLTFLRDTCGVKNVGRFVTRLPPVLGFEVTELERKWRVIEEFGMTSYELVRFPAFFSYPYERIKVRFEYMKFMEIKRVPLDVVLRWGDGDFAENVCGDRDGGKRFREWGEEERRRWKEEEDK